MDTTQNVSDVHRFLGMVSQLGKFIPHLAEKTKAQRDLLSKKNEFMWGHEQQETFRQFKTEFSQFSPTMIPAKQPSYQLMHYPMESVQFYSRNRKMGRTSQLLMLLGP